MTAGRCASAVEVLVINVTLPRLKETLKKYQVGISTKARAPIFVPSSYSKLGSKAIGRDSTSARPETGKLSGSYKEINGIVKEMLQWRIIRETK